MPTKSGCIHSMTCVVFVFGLVNRNTISMIKRAKESHYKRTDTALTVTRLFYAGKDAAYIITATFR